MKRNEEAATLAAIAAVLLLVSGYTGARSIDNLFDILRGLFGPNPVLRAVAFIFILIASLGGFSVLFGGLLIWQEHVRFGRVLILVGSGAGFFTLVLFLLMNFRREEFSYLASVLPVILGVAMGVVARFRAVPRPFSEILRPS